MRDVRRDSVERQADDGILAAGARIEAHLDELARAAPEPLRAKIQDLVASVVAFHGGGLGRLLAILESAGALDRGMRARLAADDLVTSLLLLHGLHPVPLAERVQAALEEVRPALRAHAGGVELAGIDAGGVLRLRLLGSCDGCASSRGTIEATIEQAVFAAAPELTRIEVEGAAPHAPSTLVQIGRPGQRLRAPAPAPASSPASSPAPAARTAAGERCELCAEAVGEGHLHVVDLEQRTIGCACPACALLFKQAGASSRYITVPERVLEEPGFCLEESAWTTLEIPVRLAFVFRNSRLDRWVAVFPSPAGPTEAEISDERWQAAVGASALAAALVPDVEALVAYRRQGGPAQCYLAPIDACYRLVGRVRLDWKGFHGGDAAWAAIDAFFADLRTRCRPLRPVPAREVTP
jgi:Fe-S cluster biogenesis protein NfuA